MKISYTYNGSGCILKLHSSVVSLELISRLKKMIEQIPRGKKIALNFQNVEKISADFFDFIKEIAKNNKISIINLPAELFALLNLTNHNQFVYLFLDEADFFENKRLLVNRKFSVLGNN